MTTDPRVETMKYFEQHQVLQIFDYLGSKLASEKPADPNTFLLNEITKINAARTRGQKVALFTEKDVRALFSVFDLTNRGYLTKEQYLRGFFLSFFACPKKYAYYMLSIFAALEYVGVDSKTCKTPDERTIDLNTFVKSM
jgi:hypothetical protein